MRFGSVIRFGKWYRSFGIQLFGFYLLCSTSTDVHTHLSLQYFSIFSLMWDPPWKFKYAIHQHFDDMAHKRYGSILRAYFNDQCNDEWNLAPFLGWSNCDDLAQFAQMWKRVHFGSNEHIYICSLFVTSSVHGPPKSLRKKGDILLLKVSLQKIYLPFYEGI